jgi:hypothetical protein
MDISFKYKPMVTHQPPLIQVSPSSSSPGRPKTIHIHPYPHLAAYLKALWTKDNKFFLKTPLKDTIIDVMCRLITSARNNIGWAHSVFIQRVITDKAKYSTATVKEVLLSQLPEVFLSTTDHIKKSWCREYNFNPDFLNLPGLQDAISADLDEEFQLYATDRASALARVSERNKYFNLSPTAGAKVIDNGNFWIVPIELLINANLINTDPKLTDFIRHVFYTGEKLPDGTWKLPIRYYEPIKGGRRYEIGGGIQTLPNIYKNLLVKNCDFINLDLKNAHNTIALRKGEEFGIVTPKVRSALSSQPPEGTAGNEKIWKILKLAALNGLGSSLVNKSGQTSKLGELISEFNPEDRCVAIDLVRTITRFRYDLCKLLRWNPFKFWAWLQGKEQKLITSMTDLLESSGIKTYVNMHDGILIQGRDRFLELGLLEQLEKMAECQGLSLVEKKL